MLPYASSFKPLNQWVRLFLLSSIVRIGADVGVRWTGGEQKIGSLLVSVQYDCVMIGAMAYFFYWLFKKKKAFSRVGFVLLTLVSIPFYSELRQEAFKLYPTLNITYLIADGLYIVATYILFGRAFSDWIAIKSWADSNRVVDSGSIEDPELLAAAETKLKNSNSHEDLVIVANLEAAKGYDGATVTSIVSALHTKGIHAVYYDSPARMAFDAVSIFVIKVPVSQREEALAIISKLKEII